MKCPIMCRKPMMKTWPPEGAECRQSPPGAEHSWSPPPRFSARFENEAVLRPTGFREYDARWQLGSEFNLNGARIVGLALAEMIRRRGGPPEIVIGHDFRAYSLSVKMALACGLISGGLRVHDIGLGITPMAYFAQGALGIDAVAMVTASHNENGWTGLKMGLSPPLTLGPQEMSELRDVSLSRTYESPGGGNYTVIDNMMARYIAALAERPRFARRITVVVSCGNGTAGLFAPPLLRALGADVIELDCTLDPDFPVHNPNPENMAMLRALGQKVVASGADIGLAFDGDGDRLGVVDERGREIFSDRAGLFIARSLAPQYPGRRIVVDVKSTGLFARDPVLRRYNVAVDYWKTGHSHIKRRMHELGALAGFEKSGHMFFGPPLGRGYDDAMAAAIALLDVRAAHGGMPLSGLDAQLAPSFMSPTLSAPCPDEEKYQVSHAITQTLKDIQAAGQHFAGQPICDIVTVNGARIEVEDGSWALVRASSNKPELVIVVESPVSGARMQQMFEALDVLVRRHDAVGPCNQALHTPLAPLEGK